MSIPSSLAGGSPEPFLSLRQERRKKKSDGGRGRDRKSPPPFLSGPPPSVCGTRRALSLSGAWPVTVQRRRRRRRVGSSNGCVVFCPVFARPPPSSYQLAAFSIFSRIRKIGPRKFSNTCPGEDISFRRSPCISTVPIYKHTTVCRKTREAWGGSPVGYHLFLFLLRLYHRSEGEGGGGGIRITHTKVRGEEVGGLAGPKRALFRWGKPRFHGMLLMLRAIALFVFVLAKKALAIALTAKFEFDSS